jgi:hypothetical protein
MLQDQPNELPTRYDLYYFKWKADGKGGSIYIRIQYALKTGFITDQETDNYYYWLMLSRIQGISWERGCDYDILTDYDQPRVLTRSKTHILDYRGKKFDSNVILESKNICNDLGSDEYGEDDFINVDQDPYEDDQSLNVIPDDGDYEQLNIVDNDYDLILA